MSNPHVEELLRLMRNRYDIDRDTMSYGDWICANTTLRNRRFSFDKYPFQKAIADDMNPTLTTIKISQIGLTEVQIRKMLAFLKRNFGTTGIFTFPDDDMRKRNSQQRIAPVLEDKVFNLNNDIEKPIRSIQLNQIGSSFLNVVGNKESDATSTSADIIFQDEVDLSDQAMLALFSSRLQGSDWKIMQKFSTPTYTGFGIDADYSLSDQKIYMIKCDSCNHWQYPLFHPDWVKIPNLSNDIGDLLEIDQAMVDSMKLDLVNAEIVCSRCGAPLDLGRADNRNWVATHPSRTHHSGYRVNPFTVSTLNVAYIVNNLLKYKQANFLRGFKNTVLGEADDSSNNRLNHSEITSAFTHRMVIDELSKTAPTWIGSDMGQTCHIMIGQGYALGDVEVVRVIICHVDQIVGIMRMLCETLNVIGGLVDRHPYEPTADAIRAATNGKILPCEYRGDKTVNPVYDPTDKERVLHIQANRTTLLDEVKKGITGGGVRISGYGEYKELITQHLRNMVREEVAEQPAVWRKLDENDHFFHALGFMLTSLKVKNLLEAKHSVPQSFIGVAGADVSGYNSNILGQKSSSSNLWQPLL